MTPRTPARRPGRRSGMTLTEVLFAMGILLIGVLSIMSLVPVAIHQVATSSDNTLGAAIGQNVLVSLRHGQVDMGDYDVPDPANPGTDLPYHFSQAYRSGQMALYGVDIDSPLYNYANWPAAIFALHRADIDAGNSGYGHGGNVAGQMRPSFRIPGDTPVFTDAAWNAAIGRNQPQLVPVPWAQDYYWSATFLPIPADHDNAGGLNDDPYDGTSGTGADDLIMPSTSYRVQVAAWRVVNRNADLMLYDESDGITADWTRNSDQVTNLSADISRANQYDYIRMDDYGVWYRIDDYDAATDTVTLVTPFQHPDATTPFTGRSISVASDFKLIGAFEGVIASPEVGGNP